MMNQIPEKNAGVMSSSGTIPVPRSTASERVWKASPAFGYFLAAALPPLFLLIRLAFPFRIEDPPVVNFFLIPIALASYFGRLGAGLMATILSAALADYFLLAPEHSFFIERPVHLVMWGLLGICGFLINGLTELMHRSRRRAEQTGELLTVTLASIGDAVITTDLEGRITFLNAEAERITGWPDAAARGQSLQTVFRIINEFTRQPVIDPTSRVLETGSIVGLANHTLLIARDGHETPIEDSAAPIREENGKIRGIVLIFRDCSERHRKEHALSEARAQLTTALETGKIGVWTWHLQEKYTTWDESLMKLLQVRPADPERAGNEEFLNRVHPDDRPGCLVEILQAIRERQDVDLDFRFVRQDGEIIHVASRGHLEYDTQGEPVRMIGASVDLTARKKAEAALRESEERFRLLLEYAGDAYFLHDDRGNLLEVNQQACESLGYSREELLNLNFTQISDQANLASLLKTWAGTAPGASDIATDHTHRRKDGTHFPVEVRVTCYSIQENKLFLAVVRDISERVQAEQAILKLNAELEQRVLERTAEWQKSVTLLEAVINGTTDAVFIKDYAGRYLLLNQATADFLQRPIEEVLGKDDTELFSEESAREIRKNDVRIMEENRFQMIEENLSFPGAYRCFLATKGPYRNAEGEVIGLVGISREVTAMKMAEAALRESEARFRQLVESMPQMVFMAAPGGRTDYLSRRWFEFTGMSEDRKETWPEYIHPEDSASAVQAWQAAITDGTNFAQEYRLKEAGSGEYRWILARALPVHDETGQIIRWIGTCTNIHEMKTAQAQLQQARDTLEKRTTELDAVNKELESFSYSISHDLRAPVRAMDGFAEALREDYAEILPAEGMRYVDVIRGSAKRMGSLIDDLLAFSKLGRLSVSRQNVDTAQLVQEIIEGCDDHQGRKVEIRAGELPACCGDRALLKQVWTNLLSNALKYTSNRPQTLVEVGAKTDSGETVYFVRDNGAGFDMRYAHKLFGVFQRLHHEREFPGTGVGLAIVHRIVTRHGGRIWAESGVDQGATFFFTLELETPPAS